MSDQDPVSQFSSGGSARMQLEAVKSLVKAKRLNSAWQESTFPSGIGLLVSTIENPGNGDDRLRALSAVGRIGASVRNSHDRLADALRGRLGDRLPPLQRLDDPDDRYYAATVWRYASADWMSDYLAESAVQEEAGKDARAECLEGLLSCACDLQSALDTLAKHFGTLRFDTKKPADSMGRRLRSVLDPMARLSASGGVQTGSAPGRSLARVVEVAFGSIGLPESEDVRVLVAEGALALVDRMVRIRFSLATDGATYSVLDVFRGWVRSHDWSDFIGRTPSARLVSDDLLQALRILARAGLTDEVLYRHLTASIGGEREAREAALDLATTTHGLSEGVQAWLRGAQIGRTSALASESQERSADEIFGELLLEARNLSKRVEHVRDEVIPELRVVAPSVADRVRDLVDAQVSAVGKIELLGTRRGLNVRLRRDDVLEYSALEHELAGGDASGVRHVRVVSPLVEAVSPTGVRRIVRKAVVERIGSARGQN